MKRILSLLLSVTMLLGACATLASCGEPKDNGAEISVYLGEVFDLDPTDYYVDSNAEQVMSLLFEPLFSVNERGKLKCDAVAEDYKVDKDERQIVIELRETYWSDGVRVTAADFVHAWRDVLLEPNNANPAAALLYDIENAAAIKRGDVSVYADFGAEATEIYELTLTYREGADYEQLLKNLSSVATSPMRQDLVFNENEGYWSKFINTAITNGAFMIADYSVETGSFTIARNTGYHQDPLTKNYTKIVRPGSLVSFISYLDDEAQALTYKDIEEKTVFYISDAPLADRADNKDKAITSDDLSTYTYVFNTDNPLFAIKEVRQALSLAIDRNEIINAITFGKAATAFLPKDIFDSKDLISASANPTKAAELLAGVDFTGVSKSFKLTVNDDEESLKIAELVKESWGALGFNVTIDARGAKMYDDKSTMKEEEKLKFYDSELQLMVNDAARGERDFDVIAIDWQLYSTDAFVGLAAFSTEFSGCGAVLPANDLKFGSFGGYRSEEYDALIADAFAKEDEDERREVLYNAEAKLLEDAAIVPLVFNQNFAFVSEDISKVEVNGLGDFVLTGIKQKNYEDYLK